MQSTGMFQGDEIMKSRSDEVFFVPKNFLIVSGIHLSEKIVFLQEDKRVYFYFCWNFCKSRESNSAQKLLVTTLEILPREGSVGSAMRDLTTFCHNFNTTQFCFYPI